MEKATKWFGLMRLALIIAIAASAIYTAIDVNYALTAADTGMDPLDDNSNWSPVLAIGIGVTQLLQVAALIFLLVASIGFVFRSAQWLKSQDVIALGTKKPGWVIAGYLIPAIGVIIPFLFMMDLNKGGFRTDKQKSSTRSLLFVNLALSFGSSSVTKNQLMSAFSNRTITFDEFLTQEWQAISGSVLDIASMILMLFIAKGIHTGLVNRASGSGVSSSTP